MDSRQIKMTDDRLSTKQKN